MNFIVMRRQWKQNVDFSMNYDSVIHKAELGNKNLLTSNFRG